MLRAKDPPLVSGVKYMAIVVLTICVFIIVDFGRRATAGYYVSQAEKDLKVQIQAELELQKELKARRDHVLTDEYVVKWAREEAHMVLPGDQAMILITPQATGEPSTAVPSPSEREPSTVVPSWYDWWLLFFDTEPGPFRLE